MHNGVCKPGERSTRTRFLKKDNKLNVDHVENKDVTFPTSKVLMVYQDVMGYVDNQDQLVQALDFSRRAKSMLWGPLWWAFAHIDG